MKRFRKPISVVLSLLLVFLCFACLSVPRAEAASQGICSVIFMIGDGMGMNHLRLAEQEGYTLFMESGADLSGWSRTRSYSHTVTDSAAGATALSCGVRITNRQLCVFPSDMNKTGLQPRIITENALSHGMRVGIVTTDKTNGATPGGFSVHTDSRDNADDISAQQLSSGFDLIWGAKTSTVSKTAAAEHGYTYVSNVTELRALETGTRSFAQLPSDCWKLTPSKSSPTLAEMTARSLSLLSADAPYGFFLMVEGAHIDKISDDTGDDGAVDYPSKRADTAEAVAAFDLAVQAAVEFARQDGHTMVIVTADHETGNLYADDASGEYAFHSASHTGKDVPVFVYCASDLFAEGAAVNNSDFANLIASRLGWEERFPIEDPAPVQEPSGSEGGAPAESDGRNFFRRVIDWFRALFQSISDWFRR